MSIITKLRILRHLWKVLDRSISQDYMLTDPLEKDLRDLAVGRWESFKRMHALDFVIGLDNDSEYELYCCGNHAIPSMKVKMSSSLPVPFTGAECLERAALMETWCRAMVDQHQTVEEWIAAHDNTPGSQ